MSKVHLFYPENDLALAAGLVHYTPPAAALRLSQAGAMLPLWYGESGDKVFCRGVNGVWLERMQRDFNLNIDVYSHKWTEGMQAAPWGWSLSSRQKFIEDGFPKEELPSDEEIVHLKELSHRRTALSISDKLRIELPWLKLPPCAIEAKSPAEVTEAFKRFGKAVVKLPWSCSGRGVANIEEVGHKRALDMALNGLRTQGSVIIEPALEKALDFALLFVCDKGECSFVGTSVFTTDSGGHYLGNMLAPEEKRLQKVGEFYPIATLQEIAKCLKEILETTVAPYYSGALGVDMLIDKRGMIHPTVELNLRMTMGHVANVFADHHLAEGREGVYKVVPLKGITSDGAENYQTEGCKLSAGSLVLTPSKANFQFVAEVLNS